MSRVFFTEGCSPGTLTKEQLEALVKSQYDLLLLYLEKETVFDVQRIRLLLEMGQSEAYKRFKYFGETESCE